MGDYYKVDTRKLSLREYWNIRPSCKVLIPWIAGRFGIQFGSGDCFKLPDSVAEMEVPEGEFLPQARASLQPALDEALKCGFTSPRYYSFQSLRGDTKTSFISLLHRSGEFSIRLMHTIGMKVNPPIEKRLAVLLSELNDGTYFVSSDSKPTFRPTPGTLVNRVIGATVSELTESHEKYVTDIRWKNPAKPVRTPEMLDDLWNRYEKFTTRYGVERGLYVKMSPEEIAQEENVMTGAKVLSGGNTEHADVMLELSRLQNKKAGWSSAIWILIVSVALFVIAGAKQWSLDYLLILLPVLFIHELGHYLAMRAFHYRNLRMFFIPFFGAAVSGQHYNVPGWKKVVVSLMGPVPGILLGAALGIIGFIYHVAILKQIAVVAVILNGFNLLPLLPLDGGWVFHALLFSRHYVFDMVFRILAAIGLFAVGVLTHSKILTFLGIPMLLSVPMNYRMGRIATELRKRGLPPVSEDAQTIPPETAQAIITEVKKTMSKGHTSRMVADQTLQIFEMLNARPPGWIASIGLFIVHLASITLAAAVLAFLFLGSHFLGRDISAELRMEPKRPLSGSVMSWNERALVTAKEPITIVADCANRVRAEQLFSSLTNRVAESANVQCLGETVLLTADRDQEMKWLKELKPEAKLIFVDRSNTPAMFTLSCRFESATAKKAVEDELSEYLDNHFTGSLVPPYLGDDSRTAEQRAGHRLARQSFRKAREATNKAQEDPRLQPLKKQLAAAVRKEDFAEVRRLGDSMAKLSAEIAAEHRERVKKGDEGPVDPAMVDLFSEYSAKLIQPIRPASPTSRARILQRMGEIAHAADAETRIHPYSMRNGLLSSKDKTLTLTWCSFVHLPQGVPTLLNWLRKNGASDFKYDIASGEGFASDEDW